MHIRYNMSMKLENYKKWKIIPALEFAICKIDGRTREEITQIIKNPPKKQQYYIEKFDLYLKRYHNIDIKEYCIKYLNFIWPKCPVTGKDVGYKKSCGAGLIINTVIKGVGITQDISPRFKEFVNRMKEERKGEGNPMFQKKAWNAGHTSDNCEITKARAEKSRGRKASEEAKLKQSNSAKKRLVHGHTGIKHTEKSKEKMREETAKRYSDGTFKRKTSIEIKIEGILSSLHLRESYETQYHCKYYSIDFAFVNSKIAIEADGDYFHVNPEFFPNGPVSSVQKRNAGRDKAKNKYLTDRGWTIIRFWENQINQENFKEILICKLRELNLLDE